MGWENIKSNDDTRRRKDLFALHAADKPSSKRTPTERFVREHSPRACEGSISFGVALSFWCSHVFAHSTTHLHKTIMYLLLVSLWSVPLTCLSELYALVYPHCECTSACFQ